MRLNTLLPALCLISWLHGCATTPSRHAWENRLSGDNIVLLGEVHDNAEHHRLRLDVLRRAFDAGWRPSIAMEQFDRERQPDIERARRERPRDAQHLIDLAGLNRSGTRSNWAWDFYRPFVELALAYDLPLIAANLSRADIGQIMKGGYAALFDAQTINTLGLTSVPADLQAVQEQVIEQGHCNALPPHVVPAMTRGQLARDAVMASIVSHHSVQGIVLLAGNSHVRRDRGAPRWLDRAHLARTYAVGYLENPPSGAGANAFDAVVPTKAAERPDPCLAFKKRIEQIR